MQPCRIHKRYFAHPDDTNAGFVADGFHTFVEFIGDTEKERAVDFIYFDSLRYDQFFFFMVDFALVRQIELLFGNRDMRYFAHSFHKEYQGQ